MKCKMSRKGKDIIVSIEGTDYLFTDKHISNNFSVVEWPENFSEEAKEASLNVLFLFRLEHDNSVTYDSNHTKPKIKHPIEWGHSVGMHIDKVTPV